MPLGEHFVFGIYHQRGAGEVEFQFVAADDGSAASGVVLVGGDIHRSRCIVHATEESAGYDIPEFITSPMHDRIIATANQPHPGLQFDTGSPNSYLLLETKTGSRGNTISARFMAVPAKAKSGEELFASRHKLRSLSGQ